MSGVWDVTIREHRVTDDLQRLIDCLPPRLQGELAALREQETLLEVVMDLGRQPELRTSLGSRVPALAPVARDDLAWVVDRLGGFGPDNRAGIEGTLHRISALRNRSGAVVGLTCRVGRAVYGTVAMVRDLLDSGQSMLLLGRPGVGKTTALREIARVLADDLDRRVVVIDTSNEIAGDGDIPHPAIGRARRLQVPRPGLQHRVMIEAVENHMPEVIVIDEIGTEAETRAARTIAERGVQLVATAHGNELANLLRNPSLQDLLGGIETVTLGDEEARRRGSRKAVLERAADPTFPLAVELQSRSRWLVHLDVAGSVDRLLRGETPHPEVRAATRSGSDRPVPPTLPQPNPGPAPPPLSVFCCGISPRLVDEAAVRLGSDVRLADDPEGADAVLAGPRQLGLQPEIRRRARHAAVPIHVIKADSGDQVQRALERLLRRCGLPGV